MSGRTADSGAMTFMGACSSGLAGASDIDDWVHDWHTAGGLVNGEPTPLRVHLGMSWDEYGHWVQSPSSIGLILASRMGAMSGTELRMLPRNADYEAGFLAGFAYARTYSRNTPSKLDLQRQRELTEMAQARVAGVER